MRHLVLITALLAAGCAGQPVTKTDPANLTSDGSAAAAPAKQARVVPERVKGPYKVVMKGDKKLYCSRERETGSHVSFRTICLTQEEYRELEEKSREWKTLHGRQITPTGEVFPGANGAGMGPGGATLPQ